MARTTSWQPVVLEGLRRRVGDPRVALPRARWPTSIAARLWARRLTSSCPRNHAARPAPQIGSSPVSFSSAGIRPWRSFRNGLTASARRRALQRLAALALVHADETKAGERAEVARLQRQHPVDIGERAVVLAQQEQHGGALVPAFRPLRRAGDDVVQDRQRQPRDVAHRQHGALHGLVEGRIARLHPDLPDLGNDRVAFRLVFGRLETAKQGIEALLASRGVRMPPVAHRSAR